MPFSGDRDLPEEIFAEIVSLCSQDTLAALSRASKRSNRIATAYLYSDMVVLPSHKSEAGSVMLLPFAYLVFTSPTHASLVRSITVPQALGQCESAAPLMPPANESEINEWPPESGTSKLERVLRKKCAEYAVDETEADQMYRKFEGGDNEDGVFALLLASLPNLRRLDVDVGETSEHEAFGSLIETITSRARSFDKKANPTSALATAFSVPIDIMVKADAENHPNHPNRLAPFLHLPNIRSIYGISFTNNDVELKGKSPFTRLPHRSCPVEYIEFRSSKFKPLVLQAMLDAAIPGKLKAFNYEVGCMCIGRSISHVSMLESLAAHYNTLESLGFSHEQLYPHHIDQKEGFEGISFTCFTALKRLKVAPVYIWGHEGFPFEKYLKGSAKPDMLWESLPQSLEELWITRATQQSYDDEKFGFAPDCLIPALELVVQHRSEAFPKLNRILIQIPLLGWKWDWLELLASFCTATVAIGIDCTIFLDDWNSEEAIEEYDPRRRWGWYEDVEWQPCMFNELGQDRTIVVSQEEDLCGTLASLKCDSESQE
jgi:hypothetical protein